MNRKGDDNKTWFKSDRIFCVGNRWYIATRERANVGPFNSRMEAKQALPNLLNQKQSVANLNLHALKMATSGVWGVNNYV